MKRFLTFNILMAIMMFAITGCNGDNDENGNGNEGGKGVGTMTMATSKSGEVEIFIAGSRSGTFTIDWGDGSAILTLPLLEYDDGDWLSKYVFRHNYSIESTRLITIAGENITHLDCQKNQLTTLDVSKNSALIYLQCWGNQLTSLNVSGCTALTYLGCSGGNKLTTLDVSKNSALTWLICHENQLTTLDVSKNTKLESLGCVGNPLITLNVSNTALTELDCNGIGLTNLYISNNVALTSLHSYNNKLTTLDVSGCSALRELDCGKNQLDATALNALFETLHSNPIEKYIYIYNNPGTSSCNRSIATNKGWNINEIPNVYVDFTIDLADPEFISLTSVGESVVVNKFTNNWGYRAAGFAENGIIIHSGIDEFFAYDCTCPHDYVLNEETIKIEIDKSSSIFAVCTKCRTKYGLPANGTPVEGAGRYPLKTTRQVMMEYVF